ncbi:hypothetical protein QL285_085089 [Trifolium repens]|nr:hypothetical protein QL285_085089 [Trifolium repens]
MLLYYDRQCSKYLTVLEGRYLAWLVHTYLGVKTEHSYWKNSNLSSYRRFSFLDTLMHNTSYVHLYHGAVYYSRIDLNIKRVENCLNTTDSSANKSDSPADEPIVVR